MIKRMKKIFISGSCRVAAAMANFVDTYDLYNYYDPINPRNYLGMKHTIQEHTDLVRVVKGDGPFQMTRDVFIKILSGNHPFDTETGIKGDVTDDLAVCMAAAPEYDLYVIEVCSIKDSPTGMVLSEEDLVKAMTDFENYVQKPVLWFTHIRVPLTTDDGNPIQNREVIYQAAKSMTHYLDPMEIFTNEGLTQDQSVSDQYHFTPNGLSIIAAQMKIKCDSILE